ncbi:helix-turn-helix domain-containing protein [Mesomycoplasma ovipneumoniae]
MKTTKNPKLFKIISSNWETREYISLKNIERICEELNCKIEDVIKII